MFPETVEGEFKNYEINPFIDNVSIKNNKIFIEIKRLSSFLIQETTVNITYRRQFTKGLKFDISHSLHQEDKGEFMLNLHLKNKYPFIIKNLFYVDETLKTKLGEFLDSSKYQHIFIYNEGAPGYVEVDKDGKLNFMAFFPTEPGGEMHFLLKLKEISNIKVEEIK